MTVDSGWYGEGKRGGIDIKTPVANECTMVTVFMVYFSLKNNVSLKYYFATTRATRR
jgi:hypothetical protein